jgi:glycosyltransferase involved in cell wall biosynthesis
VLVPGYYTLPGIAAALWARVHRVPSILMTESCAFDHTRTGWKERLKSLVLRILFDWAVTGGTAHVAYLRELGFPANRITGFYDVVDNELFLEGTQALRADSAVSPRSFALPVTPYFLYVGRLAREKNVYTLLASWNDYRKAGGTWPLVLVGDGPEAARLKAAALECAHPDDVYFPGLKSSRDLLPYYAFAGCFVLPSTREPWGLVVNEAMASSLPVLVSDRCGCAPDLVQSGVNGYLFDPRDGVALAALLARFEQLGRPQHEAMAHASAEIIRSFSPQRFGHSIASITSSGSRSGSFQTMPSTSGGSL